MFDFRKPTDARVRSVELFYLPVPMRMPLKFGSETVTSVTCARVAVTLEDAHGKVATGWGETPLSVTWAWPSAALTYDQRYRVMTAFCEQVATAWANLAVVGHPLEIGHAFVHQTMPELLPAAGTPDDATIPHLAALIVTSAFDLATHDAYGILHGTDVYKTYGPDYLSFDLDHYLTPEADSGVSFSGKYPCDYLLSNPSSRLPVWHLVGGLDPLEESDRSGNEPDDGYPVTLRQWIQHDGLECLKIKLRGNDSDWDYSRIVAVGSLAMHTGVKVLSVAFNCTVGDPEYVNEILDRLAAEHPGISQMILYVEQPFPYDLESNQLDVSSVSQRKDLFLD